jgi:hypothetical protein
MVNLTEARQLRLQALMGLLAPQLIEPVGALFECWCIHAVSLSPGAL